MELRVSFPRLFLRRRRLRTTSVTTKIIPMTTRAPNTLPRIVPIRALPERLRRWRWIGVERRRRRMRGVKAEISLKERISMRMRGSDSGLRCGCGCGGIFVGFVCVGMDF